MKTSLKLTLMIMGYCFIARGQGPPVFSDTPIMLGLEGGGVRTFGQLVQREHSRTYIHPVAIPFNITQRWQIGGVVPFVSNKWDDYGTNTGFGDISLFTKYQLYQWDGKGRTFRGLLKVTETFPTGNSSDMPALGTGANITSVGLVNGYITTRYGLYLEVGYDFVSNDLPDHLTYNLAFGYPLLPQRYPPKQLNIFLEMNGDYVMESVGNHLFVSPGIQYIAGRKVLFESGIQFPLDRPSAGDEIQFILRAGTRVLIF